MLYTFQAKDGQTIDLPFSMAEAPPIGELIEVDGVEYKRIYNGHVAGAKIINDGKYPYLSHSMSASATAGATVVKNKRGMPKVLIESQQHEREVMAANDRVRD